jgi:NADH dehydrogenase
MILVAGGTGTLGTQVARLLTARGLDLRVLTRDPARAAHLGDGVEVVTGDVRDPDAVRRAVDGASTVISAIHGFAGPGNVTPESVDRQGNHNLIQAAQASDVNHFVLISIHGATPDHPLELFRMKALAERELQASSLAWTILRPTAYMETWARLIAEPLVRSGRTRVFGSGRNPINFVSAHDVAHFVDLAVVDPDLRGAVLEIGGPEDLTMRQLAERAESITGVSGTVSAIPLPMMRVLATVLGPVKPAIARQIRAGIAMDTADMAFDALPIRARYPSIPVTGLDEVIRRDLSGHPASH